MNKEFFKKNPIFLIIALAIAYLPISIILNYFNILPFEKYDFFLMNTYGYLLYFLLIYLIYTIIKLIILKIFKKNISGWFKIDFKKLLMPTENIMIVFIIILIMANIPLIGTKPEKCLTECLTICYNIDPERDCFRARKIFWPDFLETDLRYLGNMYIERPEGNYESVYTKNSVPLLHIYEAHKKRVEYNHVSYERIVHLLLNVLYWYLLACIILYTYNSSKKKIINYKKLKEKNETLGKKSKQEPGK